MIRDRYAIDQMRPKLQRWFERHRRDLLVAGATVVLLICVAAFADGFFTTSNLRGVVLECAPLLVAAIGMTLVMLARHIDVSVGSQLAVGGMLAGALARSGVPMLLVAPAVIVAGAGMGALNGLLVTAFGLPSIVVTLTMMVTLRHGLHWATEETGLFGLPDDFQWLGLPVVAGPSLLVFVALLVFAAFAWGLRNLAIGRAVYAVGSSAGGAGIPMAAISPRLVTFGIFVAAGALTAVAAFLGAVQLPHVQANAGMGFELAVIAAVVTGGTTISGRHGTLVGTLLGVLLLGTVGAAIPFLKIDAHWEKVAQGVILLAAVAADAVAWRRPKVVAHG